MTLLPAVPDLFPSPALGNIAFNNLAPADLSALLTQARIRGLTIEHDPVIQDTIRRFLADFLKRQGRYSANTRRALAQGWELFSGWCSANGRDSLPASLETVECYLSHRAQDKHRNTLARDKWAIGLIHQAAGCPDPTGDHRLGDHFAALVRAKVEAEETIEQAAAFREYHLDQLVALWRGSPRLQERRDLALLTVAYESLLRASELGRIRFRHLAIQSDGAAILTIPFSKANHSGEPDKVALSPQAVSLLADYLALAGRSLVGDGDELLFGRVSRHNTAVGSTRPLSLTTLCEIFRGAWVALDLARLGIPPFTGHSCRVGAAQDLSAAGANAIEIAKAGRWSNERMVLRYCRDTLARESVMAIRRAGRR